MTHAATVPAPTENLKETWEVLGVEREPNGFCRANLNLIALVRAHCQGQESLSQAVTKEGGLVSIRGNEAEGVSAYPSTICQFSACSSLCQLSVALS